MRISFSEPFLIRCSHSWIWTLVARKSYFLLTPKNLQPQNLLIRSLPSTHQPLSWSSWEYLALCYWIWHSDWRASWWVCVCGRDPYDVIFFGRVTLAFLWFTHKFYFFYDSKFWSWFCFLSFRWSYFSWPGFQRKLERWSRHKLVAWYCVGPFMRGQNYQWGFWKFRCRGVGDF